MLRWLRQSEGRTSCVRADPIDVIAVGVIKLGQMSDVLELVGDPFSFRLTHTKRENVGFAACIAICSGMILIPRENRV